MFRIIGMISTVIFLVVVATGIFLYVQYRPVLESAIDEVRNLPDRVEEQRDRVPGLGDD